MQFFSDAHHRFLTLRSSPINASVTLFLGGHSIYTRSYSSAHSPSIGPISGVGHHNVTIEGPERAFTALPNPGTPPRQQRVHLGDSN